MSFSNVFMLIIIPVETECSHVLWNLVLCIQRTYDNNIEEKISECFNSDLSSLPGRRSAGSMRSGREEAARTQTPSRPST